MIPGWVLLLLAVAVFEALTRKGRGRRTPVASTCTDELTAVFYPTKRMELDHRASTSMLADTESPSTAPPFILDLSGGKAVLRGHSGAQTHYLPT